MFLITGTHLNSSNVHKMSEQYISMTQNPKEEDKILSVVLVTKILQEREFHFHSFTTRWLSWWTYYKFTMHRDCSEKSVSWNEMGEGLLTPLPLSPPHQCNMAPFMTGAGFPEA